MTAAAHQLDDDEPQPDFAEEPMSEADFRIIARAHELCDHPAAVDLDEAAKPERVRDLKLEQHATKILGAMIFAGKLVAEMKQRGDFDHDVSDLVETADHFADGVREVPSDSDETDTDWARMAADAWNEGWRDAAVAYQVTRRNAYAWVRP
jgi:hypothetical protein